MPKHTYYLPSRKLVSQDDAAIIQRARVPRSKFQNRWSRLTTFDAGYLVPFLVDEILPGDHVRYNITAYVRMATALFPLFSNQRLDTFLFYVPNRILWDNWKKFQGEQTDPNSSINFTVPYIELDSAVASSSIYDHMGIPVDMVAAGQTIRINALPLRAYTRIWNDWFRDQNILNSGTVDSGDGPTASTTYVLRRRAKAHDYFTSALPWPQKFTPLQTLFTGTAPVIGIGAVDASAMSNFGQGAIYREADGGLADYPAVISNSDAAAKWAIRFDTNANVSATNPPQIFADLAQATGVTINALRQAWLVQDLLERDARGGTRYTEIIRSHFGVVSPDFRLQRPEYIGGGQTPINITPIAQTATGGGGLGALGGVGTVAAQHNGSYAATEHGYIIGLINIRTELAYQQGLHRMWTKSTRYDFYMPALAGLGEQAILRQEIYLTGDDGLDATVFGYQERWQEYRTRYSEVTGVFNSVAATNIDEWHLAQHFTAPPTLSEAFIQDDPPMSRVLAAGGAAVNQQYIGDILIERSIVRPIPMFGTPATLARF